MSRLWTVAVFVVAVAVVLIAFAPAGTFIGELAFDAYEGLRASGTSDVSAALLPLIGADLLALLVVFAASFFGGVQLPSGLPHLFFALFVPLAFGAAQVRFFELSGDPGNLAEGFGTYNFIALFALAIGVAQLGVHLARARHERRLG